MMCNYFLLLLCDTIRSLSFRVTHVCSILNTLLSYYLSLPPTSYFPKENYLKEGGGGVGRSGRKKEEEEKG